MNYSQILVLLFVFRLLLHLPIMVHWLRGETQSSFRGRLQHSELSINFQVQNTSWARDTSSREKCIYYTITICTLEETGSDFLWLVSLFFQLSLRKRTSQSQSGQFYQSGHHQLNTLTSPHLLASSRCQGIFTSLVWSAILWSGSMVPSKQTIRIHSKHFY